MEILRATEEWQRAGAYSVRIEGMNRQHHIICSFLKLALAKSHLFC